MINGFYQDESGNNGLGDIVAQPVHCYGGILVPGDKLVNLVSDFEAISFKIKSQIEREIKGLSAEQLLELKFFREYEIHGKPFVDGDSSYSKIPPTDRIKFVQEFLCLLKTHNVTPYAAVVNKVDYKTKTGDTNHYKMHELCFTQLIGTINSELNNADGTSFIVCDNGRDNEIEMFSRVLKQQPVGSRVYPDLQVKDSHSSTLIQLADVVVFITTVFFRNHYGFKARKNFNNEIVDLYNNHISGDIKFWEYK